MKKLKKKWGVTSNFQMIIIFIAFSITGSLTLIVKRYLFELIGITTDTSLFIIIPLYLLSIIPIYFSLLIIVGTLMGQHKFFWAFGKKSLSKFKRKK